MNFENAPLLIILMISVIGGNAPVAIATLILLGVKLLGLSAVLPVIESKGIGIGITLLTAAVLAPLASGRVGMADIRHAFTSPLGLLAIVIGGVVAWVAGQGVGFMKSSPETVTALMVGTLFGVCFLRGLAVGPLIAGGIVALLGNLFRI